MMFSSFNLFDGKKVIGDFLADIFRLEIRQELPENIAILESRIESLPPDLYSYAVREMGRRIVPLTFGREEDLNHLLSLSRGTSQIFIRDSFLRAVNHIEAVDPACAGQYLYHLSQKVPVDDWLSETPIIGVETRAIYIYVKTMDSTIRKYMDDNAPLERDRNYLQVVSTGSARPQWLFEYYCRSGQTHKLARLSTSLQEANGDKAFTWLEANFNSVLSQAILSAWLLETDPLIQANTPDAMKENMINCPNITNLIRANESYIDAKFQRCWLDINGNESAIITKDWQRRLEDVADVICCRLNTPIPDKDFSRYTPDLHIAYQKAARAFQLSLTQWASTRDMPLSRILKDAFDPTVQAERYISLVWPRPLPPN